jgi:hypothetical protein
MIFHDGSRGRFLLKKTARLLRLDGISSGP